MNEQILDDNFTEKETPYFKRLMEDINIPVEHKAPECLSVNYLEHKEGYTFNFREQTPLVGLEMLISKKDAFIFSCF